MEQAKTVKQLKQSYNKLLVRYKKAEAWADDPKRTLTEKEKYFRNFVQVVDGLNAILEELQGKGIRATSDEVLNGFPPESI